MTLRTALKAALQRSFPTTGTIRTRGNVVECLVGDRVVETHKRRPAETVAQAYQRVVREKMEAGQIRTVLASSSDEVVLREEDLNCQ